MVVSKKQGIDRKAKEHRRQVGEGKPPFLRAKSHAAHGCALYGPAGPVCKGRCQPNRLTEGLTQAVTATCCVGKRDYTKQPLSQKSNRFLPAPLTRGAFFCANLATAFLFAPVSMTRCTDGFCFFMEKVLQVGRNNARI